MYGFLDAEGFPPATSPESADLVIVNTCGFIESATEESIEAILDLARLKDSGSCKGLIVAGCLYQRYGDRLSKEMPEVDAFIGCADLAKIGEICRNVLKEEDISACKQPVPGGYLYSHDSPRVFPNGIVSVYVKIAEGCDNRCSYCTIPAIRGTYRSRPADSIVKEVWHLLQEGAKEINLIAQDTTYFGMNDAEGECLTSLLRRLDEMRGKKWLRVLYAHPSRVTNAVARAIGDSRSVCHYLEMPVQHICDDILKSMNRKSNSYDIRRTIDMLRNEVSDIAIRTTLMVGFPGETDRHFEELLAFVRDVEFDRLGVFKYSREPGTTAARLRKQVPEDTKEDRYDALMQEQLTISRRHNRSYIGRNLEVLLERKDDSVANVVIGRTYRDAPEVDGCVEVSCKGAVPSVGDFVQVEITEAHDYDLKGILP